VGIVVDRAFGLGSDQRFLLNEDPPALVAAPRAAEAHDDRGLSPWPRLVLLAH